MVSLQQQSASPAPHRLRVRAGSRGQLPLLRAARAGRLRAHVLRGLLCSSPLSGQDRRAGVSWYFPTHLLPSQRQRSKRSFPGALNEESTVTLRMTSKCSCSEQRQLLILFVAASILEGSLRPNAFPIASQLPAFWMVPGSARKRSKSAVSVLF